MSNDGFVYISHIKPIFSESVQEAIAFFESWNEHASDMDHFKSELKIIRGKMKFLTNNFNANSVLHEQFKV